MRPTGKSQRSRKEPIVCEDLPSFTRIEMSTNTWDSTALLHVATEAALAAGAQIQSVYESADFNVEIKGDGSPLTRADRLAHQTITKFLTATELPILSEEGKSISYDERRAWSRFWLVDPLDGTKEFLKRNDEFTVNIALIEDGAPVLGVVYAPACRILYAGTVGKHAIVARDVPPDAARAADALGTGLKLPSFAGERPYRVVGSRSHSSPETERYVETLRKEHPNLELVSMGSSFKLCMVAEGSADQYPRFAPTMEWDTAAAQAIVLAAGKEVLRVGPTGDPEGPVVYNKPDLLNPWFLVR